MTFKNRQFYIVEDDESVCRSLTLLLSAYGYAVKVFGCGEEFVDRIPDSAPGCLILDIHLPGMSGWETFQRLKDSGCKRQVIFISADEGGGLMKQAYQAGAVGYLQKPFKDQELIDLINILGEN